ncbi:MAG: NADH-quinone oxidoreductase subunit K [Thermoplasmata archaeon]
MGLIIDEIWKADTIVVLLLVGIGLYCLLSKGNMIKMIIGIEIMAKGVMLNFVMSGYLQNNTGLAQALVITVIVIDVVIVALALSLIVNAYKHYGTLKINSLTRLRG